MKGRGSPSNTLLAASEKPAAGPAAAENGMCRQWWRLGGTGEPPGWPYRTMGKVNLSTEYSVLGYIIAYEL